MSSSAKAGGAPVRRDRGAVRKTAVGRESRGERDARLTPRMIAWQGLSVQVPEIWDLTGFSGDDQNGYMRTDDGEDLALEVKWATEPAPRGKKAVARIPDVEVRRESYFNLLKKNAKKNKLNISFREQEPLRGTLREERTVCGFSWLADRRAVGVVWHCPICRRTVIAQVLSMPDSAAGVGNVTEAVLGSLRCHEDDPDWQTWALYDLKTQIPKMYKLESQELMNVYLRLTFAHKTSRISVEQWSLANVARKTSYLDVWIASNTKSAQLNSARYAVEETASHGHEGIRLTGGLAVGVPMIHAAREAMRLQWPATRFSGVAWECERSNKLFAVSQLRISRLESMTDAVAERTICHGPGEAGGETSPEPRLQTTEKAAKAKEKKETESAGEEESPAESERKNRA